MGQDISGPTTFRVAATHPEFVHSYTAIETGLPGFGPSHSPTSPTAAPGTSACWPRRHPRAVAHRTERAFIADYAFPSLTVTPAAFTDDDIDEFVPTYARTGRLQRRGRLRWPLSEGDDMRALRPKLTRRCSRSVAGQGLHAGDDATGRERRQPVVLDGIGHSVAMEAPDRLAEALAAFYREVDGRATS